MAHPHLRRRRAGHSALGASVLQEPSPVSRPVTDSTCVWPPPPNHCIKRISRVLSKERARHIELCERLVRGKRFDNFLSTLVPKLFQFVLPQTATNKQHG